jgi:6-phosphogluconolactonase
VTERGELRVFPDADAVARALAETIVAQGRSAVAERGRYALALAGGETPRAGYALLATPPFRDALPWPAVHVFFGDERCVPPDDPRSNYRMAAEAFLAAVSIPPENVHRIEGERDPEDAARRYARLLCSLLGDPPVFDLLLLGLGSDGHTASLFPGSDPHEGAAELVRAVEDEHAGTRRVTITPPVIEAARLVAFTVTGAEKAAALRAVRSGAYDPLRYPAQVAAARSGPVLWLVDAAAAGGA